MSDVFDAPKKEGFGVGLQIIVTDKNKNQISSVEYEMYGFDNQTADYAARELMDMVKGKVKEWSDHKAGGTQTTKRSRR